MLLDLKNIRKHYEIPGSAEKVKVLERVTLTVEKGASLAIIGPSGSGKSTLLNIMGALDRPTSGQVMLAGADYEEMDDQALAKLRNREIGFVFQLHHLLPQCTVLENVLVPTIPVKNEKNNDKTRERAEKLLKRVGLQDRLNYHPGRLSGGERQRTALVRALINRPRLLLADEPTGSLDHTSAENLARLLIEMNEEEQTTLIVVTHSLELARQMKLRYRLQDGTLYLLRSGL
jgi:ABC-type lipoprotein export system ATPase subunit